MFGDLMKQAEEQNKKMMQQLEKEEFTVHSQEELITVVISGAGSVKNCIIQEELLKPEAKDQVEDLLIDTLNRAIAQAKQRQAEHSQSSIGDMLPDGFSLDNLFGK